jgi:hypothetical protein
MTRSNLVLWPAATYRPAPDGQIAAEARRLAARDREARREPSDWTPEERERWNAEPAEYWQMWHAYRAARWPERLAAPPVWPAQLTLIALATLLMALSDRWELAVMFPVWEAVGPLDAYARRHRARQLGLAPETAPYPVFAPTVVPFLLAAAATGFRESRSKWPLYLARRLIGAVNERRSWRRALRTAAGAPRA